MGGWERFARWKWIRFAALLLIAILFLAYPWPAAGTQTYPAYAPGLSSVSPANATTIEFNSANRSIDVAPPLVHGGTVRADVVRTHFSFAFDTTAIVASQSESNGTNGWIPVSASAPLPLGAAALQVIFQSAGSTVQLAEVSVTDESSASVTLFSQNFSVSRSGWALNGSAVFGAFGSPSLTAIQVTNSATESGYASTMAPIPVPSAVMNVTVHGLIRFHGPAGPFDLALNVLSVSGTHLGYITDWASWSPYLIPSNPLAILLWTAGLPTSANVVFEANNSTGGEIVVEITNSGVIESTQPLLPYSTGERIGFVVNRSVGQGFSVTLTPPSGAFARWSSESGAPVSGLTALSQSAYLTLSVETEGPPGGGSVAVLQNPTYTFIGSYGFNPLASSWTVYAAAALSAVATVVLLAPEWMPWLRGLGRRLRKSTGSSAVRAGREWVERHALALLITVFAAGVYLGIAASFGGQPFDTWSFSVWNYAGQYAGVDGIYIQTQFVGDAVVRGGDVPWSSVGFGYGPLSAYLFSGMSAVVPELSTYPTANAFFAAFGVQAEIKWILGLFSVAAGFVAYLGIRRVTGRADLALVALVLLVFNPAVVFDSVIWGETDSVMYLLFVLFAIAAYYRPTWAMVIAGLALAFKETGVILLFPAALLVLAPRLAGVERLQRLTAGVVTLMVVTIPLLFWSIVPAAFFSPFVTVFGLFISGNTIAQPVVTPETYTVWTLFTGLTGGTGVTRLFTPSSTALVAGISYAIIGAVTFVLAWLVLLAATRRKATSSGAAFWWAATAFAAVTFTALLTGTGSRYYTLALPGLVGVLVLLWPLGRPAFRIAAATSYAVVTALAFWTMYGLFTSIMKTDVPDIRGLAFSVNPLSRFIGEWYLNNAVITLGSVGAVAVVLLTAWMLADVARADPRRWGSQTVQRLRRDHSEGRTKGSAHASSGKPISNGPDGSSRPQARSVDHRAPSSGSGST